MHDHAQATLQFGPDTANIGAARRFVRQALDAWHLECPCEVALLTSELVGNAVEHARTQIAVHIAVTDGRLRVSVEDRSAAQPVQQVVGPAAHQGRGLDIVDHLADRWGVESPPDEGKVVWFELAVTR